LKKNSKPSKDSLGHLLAHKSTDNNKVHAQEANLFNV
jgi:hypothetical protein